jgi:hypothetical protein
VDVRLLEKLGSKSTKLLALAAGVWLNHYVDRLARAFAALAP